MATFAVIDNGSVESTISADSLEIAQEITGKTCVEYFMVEPGWTYADGVWTPATEEQKAAAQAALNAAAEAEIKAAAEQTAASSDTPK